MFAAGVAQNDGVGLQMHGDVVDVDLVLASLEIQWHFLPHDGEVLVVNRQGRLRGLREKAAAKNQKTDEASVHEPTSVPASRICFNSAMLRASRLVSRTQRQAVVKRTSWGMILA